MKRRDFFLMPDYYPDFSCKMGDCRHACCEGWPVSISREDYFRLIGLDCEPDLRRRIDCGAHIIDHATPERYAQITHKYDGQCHMRMADGRCAIQATLGEDMLPEVCRLYPRAIRTMGHNECSCTASCERIIEMLFYRKEPLKLIQRSIEYTPLQNTSNTVFDEDNSYQQAFRLCLIEIMQDRSQPLYVRIYRLGIALKSCETDISLGKMPDFFEVSAAIADAVPDISDEYITDNLDSGLDIIKKIITVLDGQSSSLHDYGEAILEHFDLSNDALSKYNELKSAFETRYPDWSAGLENIMVNHMFYSRFPFGDEGMSFYDEYLAISMIYALMRFLCIGSMSALRSDDDLTDVLAAAFRMIEHMPFHKYASALLRKLDCFTPDRLAVLTTL